MSYPPAHRQRFTSKPLLRRILKPRVVVSTAILALCLVLLFEHSFSEAKSASKQDDDNRHAKLTRASETVTVHAAGRGNPWINLSDGREMPAGYTGPVELQQVLDQNLARPLALAAADFDEDGVPDLIDGYAGPGGGMITLHRGNVDSIYPNAPEAQQRKVQGTYTDSPFLSPAHVFEVPEAADFVGAGDFDADSHWDVVAAARGGNALWLFPGDGRGSFGVARRITLPGRVTTLVTGEINRADGLTDVVVGVVAGNGPKVLVFESPEGALRGQPEAYGLPAAATALALGRLDGDYTLDLAVGAGNELIVVYGRDRKLSLDEIRQADVPNAKIGRRSFPFAIRSAAIGDFRGDHRTEVSLLSDEGAVYLLSGGKATDGENNGSDRVEDWKSEVLARGPWIQAAQLVCARVSSTPVDNLLVADSANHKLHIIAGSADQLKASAAQLVSLDVEGEPMAVLPMQLNVDALSDLVILRNGQSAPTMTMSQPLAVFTVTNTNDSGTGSLRQAIFNANANAGLDTINFSIGSGVKTINVGGATGLPLPNITSPVIIDGTTQPGYAGSPLIELNGTGAGAAANGLSITATAGSSTVRGLVINRFNGAGIFLDAGGNVIAGNYIGTDVTGTVDLGNTSTGVFISGLDPVSNNTIGGTAAAARNVISGNDGDGVQIRLSGATGNLVQGNYIGTDVTGAADLGNALNGVIISSGPDSNTIGGAAAGARNIISGNERHGIQFFAGGVSMNLVQGNYIGTDVNGTADLGNTLNGVIIDNSPTNSINNTFGGTAAGARNIISGNNLRGIEIFGSGSTGNLVQGNFIGTDVSGTADLGNSQIGVFIRDAANITIGGTAAGARNVISGNNSSGIQIATSGSTGNQVQGNFIGTDVTGTAALGNFSGVVIAVDAGNNNTIGGTAAGARNVISGNNGTGISILANAATGNLVQSNFIGTDVSGTAALGNTQDGVNITFGASSNTIGGATSAAANTIAFNGGDGVFVASGVNTAILSNSIHSNTGLGIDLGANGVTANDACDGDTGANNLQNFPVLTSASTTSIQGTLNSGANTTFTIQFFANTSCDASGNGEGQTLIGSMTVTTNANCSASFNFPTSLSLGQFITATATDPNNNTSEFSACRVVTTSLQFSSATFSAGEAAGTTQITVTRSGGSGGAASVQFSTAAGGTATGGTSCAAGVDYVSTSGTLNWANGDAANKTFPITICNDTVFEGNETVNLALSNASGATLGTPSTATLTITDNDSQPTISLSDVTQAEGNSGTAAFGFTVSLSNATTQTVTVNYATANGTATAGSDYQAISGTLTFNPGITSLPVNVLVFGDTLDEDNETFFVNLSSPGNATIADNQGVGTINDDDPLPNLTISDVSQVEGNSGTTSFNFTVNLSAISGRTVTANYATADGTGTAGSDYQGIGVTALTFTPGQTSRTVTVLVNGDTTNEPDETFFVNLSGAANANITDGQGLGTILNDDGAPTLSINDVSVTEGDSGTVTAAFTVSLSPASGQTVTVNYATASGTATAGSDYQAISSTTLTFNPGITSQPVNVLVNGDTLDEDNETFFVSLSSPANATIADNQGIGTINDDDPLPNLTISDVSQAEGNSGTTSFNFTVNLSEVSGRTVTVNYATADGTGTGGSDYQGIGVTALTFTPGQTTKTVTVLVNGDTLDEDNEAFFVNLSNPTNATIADNQGVGTINDDDALPNLSISDVTQVEGNSGTTSFNFTVNLSEVSGRTVTVNYATADGTGTAGSDYQGIGVTALTFTAGQISQTVTVLVNGDTANELDETFLVNLSGAANANIVDGQGEGTIFNDDGAPTLSINDVSVTEGNSGTVNAAFTVTLSPASGQTVTVNYATTNGTATAASDYQAINATALTFNPGETSKPVTVLVIGDTLNESNETFFVNLTNAANATIADGQGVGTITNDDPVPTGNLTISGRILDDSGLSISGQLVILGGAESGSTIADSSGNYSFANLSAGNYTVTPSSGNYSFSPTNHSFNNLSVDRIANFVGTQTVVGITGRVTDSNDIGLGSVTLGLSMNGTPIGTMSTDFLGNYGFGNLPAGANYVVTPAGSFAASSLFFNSLSTNATADFKAVPTFPLPSAAISGGAADDNNNPLANVTVTLSGPITRVTSTDGAGNYEFANLAPGGNYAVTIQSNYFVFAPSRADFFNLGGSQTFNFTAAPVVVPATLPPPSDDFDSPTRDPDKWNLGTQTLPPTAFDPQVNVAQINGQLVITPRAQVSGLHYNGYVTANSFDLRGGTVSVELVQAATGGADAIFAIGSDADNFYRFIVHTAGPATSLALTATGRDGIEKPLDTTVAQLVFQINVGGVLTTAAPIPYDPVQHRFMRFRHDAPANAIVFETSPDSIDFTERHRVVLMRSVSALTAELSAGTSNPTNPGMTVFDNFGLVTSTFQFSSASYMVEEGGGSILITVTRTGSTTGTATVDYATSDGTALQTTKYIIAAGRLTFAPGEASKTFRVLIIDNAQAEGNQNLNLLLQEPTASGLNTPGRAVLTIIDNDTTVATSNLLGDPTFFVTQHYYDFLNREPDPSGLGFWVDQITGCGSDTQCIEIRRINVSAAYFLSIEFQETGFLVHRFYNLALNRPNGLPRYLEFFRDTQAIGNGVIVGADGWEALLEVNRVSYANEFATRAEFTALYPLTLSAIEYVDALYAHAAITPSAAERQAAIDEFSTPAGARGRVLRRIAESQTLSAREFNRAFVLAQYFGYLRRNPDDAPDNNLDGYNFWLNKLNEFNGNFVNAEMVKAFITSGEYRHRFGP